ncbi:MAG: hypothetical protein FWB91_00480 [Defluviitaleaceae bacterium]|nr:hypothetical protein [Defluviitaleaceae bacterium]
MNKNKIHDAIDKLADELMSGVQNEMSEVRMNWVKSFGKDMEPASLVNMAIYKANEHTVALLKKVIDEL